MDDAPIIPINAGELFVPRPPVAEDTKRSISEALGSLPAGARGALMFVKDEHGARLMTAANFGNHLGADWKAAAHVAPVAGGPIDWGVAIMGVW